MAVDIRLLLATARPAVHDFFAGLSFHVGTVAVAADVVALAPEHVARATVAVVDVAPDSAAAMTLCSALHAQRPELPILGVVCCPQALTALTLRGLLDGGVHGLIDLRARRDEAERAIAAAALGDAVLHLQLPRAATELLREAFAGRYGRRELQLQLLELVAQGLPDHEIGRRLHLSPHTVKHQIEDLRTALRVRNRTELAAWAGKNGFYAAA
jgi:DNA-binding NarL/FixJ family response regulator